MEILSGQVQLNRKLYWVLRYVKLMSDGTLSYTKQAGDSKVRGSYNINQCQITESKDNNNQKFITIQSVIQNKKTEIKLMLQKASDHKKWFDALISFQNNYKTSFSNPINPDQNQIQSQSQNTLNLPPQDPNLVSQVNAFYPNQNNIQIQTPQKNSDQEIVQVINSPPQTFQIDVLNTQYLTSSIDSKQIENHKNNVKQFLNGYNSDNFMLVSNQHNLQTYKCKSEQDIQQNQDTLVDTIIQKILDFRTAKGDGLAITFIAVALVFIIFILQLLFQYLTVPFSILLTLNIILIPMLSSSMKGYYNQLKNSGKQQQKIKGKGYISHNINDILYVLTDFQVRNQFESNIKSVSNIQGNNFQVDHYDNTSEKLSQIVYQEGQYVYVVELLSNKINRLFEVEITPCQQLGTVVNFYSTTSASNNGIFKKNDPEVIQGLDFYIKTQKANPQSPIYSFKPQKLQSSQNLKRNIGSFNNSQIFDEEDEKDRIIPVQLESSQIKLESPQKKESTQQEVQEEVNKQEDKKEEEQEQGEQFTSEDHKKAYELLQSKLETVDSIIELDESWKKLEDKGPLKVYSKSNKDTGLTMSRGQQDMNVSLKVLQDYIMDINCKKEYDEMFKEGRKVQQITDNIAVSYNRMKGKMGVEDRDFCFVQGVFEKNGKTYIIGTNWEHPECPVVKGATRGRLVMGCWVLEALEDNKTRGIYATMADPNGKIPDMIKNWAAKLQGYSVDKIKKIIEKKYPQ